MIAVSLGPCYSPDVTQRRCVIANKLSCSCDCQGPSIHPTPVEPHPFQLSVRSDGSIRFGVRAQPRARISRVTGVRQGELVVQLAAPPVDGAANAELVNLVAEILSLPKRNVEVVRGESARSKLIEVRGLSLEDTRRLIMSAMT